MLKTKKVLAIAFIAILLAISGCIGVSFGNNGGVDKSNSLTSPYYFAIKSDTEVSVRLLDKTLRRADIPTNVNLDGKLYTVTEVDASGFTSTASLEVVRLPQTIKKVGAAAFMNCANLRVVSMPAVEAIGSNAFSLAPKLSELIIPSTVKSVGGTILLNNATKVYLRDSEIGSNWLASWNNGNSLASEIEYSSSYVYPMDYKRVSMIVNLNERQEGFVVDSSYYTDNNADIDVVIPAVYNDNGVELPVVGIGGGAFIGNIFKSLTVEYDAMPIDIGEFAFAYTMGQCIDIKRDIAFADLIGEYENEWMVFASSMVDTIVLPNTIYELKSGSFAESTVNNIWFQDTTTGEVNITDNGRVELPTGLIEIFDNAFANMVNINYIEIPESVVVVRDNIVSQWNSTQTVKVYFEKLELPSGWSEHWNDNSSATIQYKPSRFIVHMQVVVEGVLTNDLDYDISAYTGDTLSSLGVSVPTSTSHDFVGWTLNGEQFADTDVLTVPITLVANWTGKYFEVTLSSYNNTEVATITVQYGTMVSKAPIPSFKTGYYFMGFWTENNKNGIRYYHGNGDSAKEWDIPKDTTLYAGFDYYIVLDRQSGYGGDDMVTASFDSPMPTAHAPIYDGAKFLGYYAQAYGVGVKYYDENMNSTSNWDREAPGTIYACWAYNITLEFAGGGNGTNSVQVKYGDPMPTARAPLRLGYNFTGYFNGIGGGVQYYTDTMGSARLSDFIRPTTIYANWEMMIKDIDVSFYDVANPFYSLDRPNVIRTFSLGYFNSRELNTDDRSGYTFAYWGVCYMLGSLGEIDAHVWEISRNPHYAFNISELENYYDNAHLQTHPNGHIVLIEAYTKDSCVADGTLVTLADGTQKKVELLDGSELLLVWNLEKGVFDTAPILFIDSHGVKEYKIIKLMFSDGTIVEVIDSHGFWDFNLNKYVFLNSNARDFIGHWFNKQLSENNSQSFIKVRLDNVVFEKKVTNAWSPVSFGNLCYYVNGMLSMPANVEGLINIFEVDSKTMKYDQEAYNRDIEQYGLFTYSDFAELIPEFIFDAFKGQYLKVSIGKGYLTWDRLLELIDEYSKYIRS